MAMLPDGRLLITEKPGRLSIWANGQLSEPLRGVPSVVYRGPRNEQGGLLDVAIDPDFAINGYVYLAAGWAINLAVAEWCIARKKPRSKLSPGY